MRAADHDTVPEPGGWSWSRPAFGGRTALLRMLRAMREISRQATVSTTPTLGMVRMITLLAGLAAFSISAALPISFFFVALSGLRAAIESSVHTYAFQAEREAGQNPAFWNAMAGNSGYDGLKRLEIARKPDAAGVDDTERRRVLSNAGRTLIDVRPVDGPAKASGGGLGNGSGSFPLWPQLTATLPVMDGTITLGQVEISRSLRPMLFETALVGMTSGSLGILMFLLLRVVPLRMLNAAIEHVSFVSAHDLLTGLPNRRLFHDRLEQALAAARRYGGGIAVFYLDLDHFKDINDLLGHPAGDTTLRTVAARLQSCLRDSDTLARLGGDEFAVIQPRLRDVRDAAILGNRLIEAIAPPLDLGGETRTIGLSVGIAVVETGTPVLPELLMKQADMALYRAKREGRGRASFYTADLDARLRERYAMETDLRLAIVEQNLTLHYQPQVDLATGRMVGAEALLRWNRPGYDLTPPDRFIALAEDTGLIVPIGRWVLREACVRAAAWPDDVSVAVNVSPVQLRRPDFCQTVIDTIAETGIAASRVELEITEGVLLRDTEETLNTLRRLREFGTKLAMDDFGTGYSSLAYISRFRFDKIKIDRSFIHRLGADPDAMAIVRAVVGLTSALGIKAIAEGVETTGQADLLRSQGCSEAQGYLFGRPVPGDVFDLALAQEGISTRFGLPALPDPKNTATQSRTVNQYVDAMTLQRQ
jgi:diguanylate cyclase (GGDEF)-like protein